MNRDVCEHFNAVDLPCDKCKAEALPMTPLRTAAQQALEALKNPWAVGPEGVANAITALKAALADLERHP